MAISSYYLFTKKPGLSFLCRSSATLGKFAKESQYKVNSNFHINNDKNNIITEMLQCAWNIRRQ